MERQAETRRLDDFQLRTGDALIVVDVQNDFLPGGKLAVTAGDEVVPALNEYQRRFVSRGLPIFATRDWHPTDHCSFTQRGGRWPAHCVAGTPGAEFAAGLLLPAAAVVISKATLPEAEAYSAFAGGDLAQAAFGLVGKREPALQRLALGAADAGSLALQALAHEVGVQPDAALHQRDHRSQPGGSAAADLAHQAAGALVGDFAAVELLVEHVERAVVAGEQAIGLHGEIGPTQADEFALDLP